MKAIVYLFAVNKVTFCWVAEQILASIQLHQLKEKINIYNI